MVTPEVVGHIDPLCLVELKDGREARKSVADLEAEGVAIVEGGRHVLRFHAGCATRERLNAIVEAEAACCPFLDLAVTGEGEELVLTIAAPDEAQPIADDLARGFAG